MIKLALLIVQIFCMYQVIFKERYWFVLLQAACVALSIAL